MQATPGPGKMSMGMPSTTKKIPMITSSTRLTNVLRVIGRFARIVFSRNEFPAPAFSSHPTTA